MGFLRWALFAGLLLLAAVSIGSYVTSQCVGTRTTAAQKLARYYCPMHPSYGSGRAGECPICGMSLDPIPAGAREGHGGRRHGGDVPGLTSVNIPLERVQLIGVRTAVVEWRAVGSQLELLGLVTPDETRIQGVQLRVSGWVHELFVSRTGEPVAAHQELLSINSPQVLRTEEEYLIELAARSTGDGSQGHEGAGLHAVRARLLLFGAPDDEIRRLGAERVAQPYLIARAPVSGVVLERNVRQGQYVGADVPLFTIADLSRVWVLADLYELDFGRVKVGDHATFTVDALPGRAYQGRIEFVYPTVSTETRTIKARLTLDNGDGLLHPGMYGRVRIASRGGQALVVPAEAVIPAGEHQYVFIARSGGRFEPRMVWTGPRDGDRVQILKGLAEHDTVVSSASFLIDSESRLKAAIAGMGSPP